MGQHKSSLKVENNTASSPLSTPARDGRAERRSVIFLILVQLSIRAPSLVVNAGADQKGRQAEWSSALR